jgi:5'-deoxynucleotidase YfbR-like HD superfamily hydrolase
MGHYILTQSNKRIDFEKPDPSQFTLDDIARALSRLPRFCGHTRKAYTVAQHSVGVSRIARALAPETLRLSSAFEGLMHDAHEAYTGDTPTPFKRTVDSEYVDDDHTTNNYTRAQARLDRAIRKQFGMFSTEPQYVKFADRLALLIEATSDNVGHDLKEWGLGLFEQPHYAALEILPEDILEYIRQPLTERRAYASFVNEFNEICHERAKVAESLGQPFTAGALTFKRR